MIEITDRGFALGDGLFETVLWERGELQRLADHLTRMADGCEVLGLPAPDGAEAERRMRQAVAEAGLERARAAVRLTLSAGPGGRGLERPTDLRTVLVATAAQAPRPHGPVRLIVSSVARNEGSPASRLKTLSYLDNVLARTEALRLGADEAVMLNTRGELACAAAANLFWIDEAGRLCTPELACGVLAGLTRARVLDAARSLGLESAEVRAGPQVLDHARGVFITNSLIGLRPASALAGRELPQDRRIDALARRLDQ